MRPLLSILTLLLLLPLHSLRAQAPVSVAPVGNVALPWGLSNLSMVDGTLYALQNGILVSAHMDSSTLTALTPDTALTRLCPDANYVVRNGGDSLLYFITPTDDQPYSLNVHTNARFFKNRRVEVKSWFRQISHPVFSADGSTLIFSSKGKVGLGGFDLWCSFWNGKRWSKPVNLGNTINTQGDEISPVFYGNYLVYASNGRPDGGGRFNLYAVRIRPGSKVDDVIFADYVVQPLPAPLNSAADDYEIAFDTLHHRGYFLSSRNGQLQLFTFSGHLDGVKLSGTVSDDHGRPLPQAQVRLLSEGRLIGSAQTASDGTYSLFALPDDGYTLQVSKPDYFLASRSLSLFRPNEDLLIAPRTFDITLPRLPFDRAMVFDNIFLDNADIELSNSARQALQPIVDFLRDNPNVHVQFTLRNSKAIDRSYANLVIERRINNIRQYLKSCLPSNVRISFKNGLDQPQNEADEHRDNAIFVELFR